MRSIFRRSIATDRRPFPVRPPRKAKSKKKYVALAVTIAVLYFLFGTNFFYAQSITVEGTTYIRPQTLTENATRYLEEHRRLGFISSRYFFTLPVAKLKEALSSVRVANITISRIPPGQLVIRIAENIPVANVAAGGRWYEIDNSGTVIGESFAPKPASIKISLLDHIDPLEIGGSALSLDVLSWLQSADAALPATIPNLNVSERTYLVDEKNSYSVTVKTDAGWTVRLNRELPMEAQVAKLHAFYENRIANKKPWPGTLRYIDLRFSNTRVYYQD